MKNNNMVDIDKLRDELVEKYNLSKDENGIIPVDSEKIINHELKKANKLLRNISEENIIDVINELFKKDKIKPSNIITLKKVYQFTLDKGDRAYSEYFEDLFYSQLNKNPFADDEFCDMVDCILFDVLKINGYNSEEEIKKFIMVINHDRRSIISFINNYDLISEDENYYENKLYNHNDSRIAPGANYEILGDDIYRTELLKENLDDFKSFLMYDFSEIFDENCLNKMRNLVLNCIINNYQYTEDDYSHFMNYVCDVDPYYNNFIRYQIYSFFHKQSSKSNQKKITKKNISNVQQNNN